MLLRVVVGDRNTVRGVVELEASRFTVDGEMVTIYDAEGQPIVTYLPGACRSITDVDRFKAALKAGMSDENSRGRGTTRPLQAV